MNAVFGAVLIGLLFKCVTVSAIDCFHCSDCSVPFDEDKAYKEACENQSCMKLNTTQGSVSVVSRRCSDFVVEEEGCETKVDGDTYTETCYCNSDECNGSPDTKMTSTIWMLLVKIMTPIVILKYINI